GEEQLRFTIRPETHHTLAPTHGCGHVETVLFIKSKSLRTSQTAVENFHLARVRDAVYGIEARRGGPRHVKILLGTEGEMISGDRRFERRENEDLTVGADLENRAAAIADVKIVLFIECEAAGYAHSFDINGQAAIGSDLI